MGTMLQDQNGNTSSKRIIALVSFIISCVLALVALTVAKNPEIAVDLVNAYLLFSGGLLGISVAEFFKKG